VCTLREAKVAIRCAVFQDAFAGPQSATVDVQLPLGADKRRAEAVLDARELGVVQTDAVLVGQE